MTDLEKLSHMARALLIVETVLGKVRSHKRESRRQYARREPHQRDSYVRKMHERAMRGQIAKVGKNRDRRAAIN